MTYSPTVLADRVDRLPLGRADDAIEREAAAVPAPALPTTAVGPVQPGGSPLPGAIRGIFEGHFGSDLSGVRVHTDPPTEAAAARLGARAFTAGRHIGFGRGEYQPGTTAGASLLAHELTHVLQWERAGRDPRPTVRRQPVGAEPDATAPPPISVPRTGLTLFPAPWGLREIEGVRIPLPASLRVTNALSIGAGPSYVLDLAPGLFVGSLLGRIDLSSSPTAGTAPGHEEDPAQQSRISLVRPVVRLNPATGRLTGTATLQVPTGYPLNLRPPNDVAVNIESSEFGRFTGQLAYGPLHADFTLRLSYDVPRIDRAIAPAFAPAGGLAGFWGRLTAILADTVPGARLTSARAALESIAGEVVAGRVQGSDFAVRVLALVASSIPATVDRAALTTALSELGQELRHPGFALTGSLRLGGLPLSGFSVTAPTTRPLARPLIGAPTAFPSTLFAGGVIIAPAGAITSVAVPAFGATYSSFGARSGVAATAALLPTLSPTAISAGGPPGNMFPVYAFAEVTYVRRFGTSVDLGVRATVQLSTAAPERPETPGPGALPTPAEQRAAPPPVPNIGASLIGRF